MSRFLWFIPFFLWSACSSGPAPASPSRDSAEDAAADNIGKSQTEIPDTLLCSDLHDHRLMAELATREGASLFPFLFFEGLDTANVNSWEDHFMSKDRRHTVVFVPGENNWASGPAHVLMLFDCSDNRAELLLIESVGDLDSIADLDGDGIIDFIHSDEYMHMGEWSKSVEIISFAGGKPKTLYTCRSYLVTDGWLDEEHIAKLKRGDTLGCEIRLSFSDLDSNGLAEITEHRKYSTFNGGKNYNDLLKKTVYLEDSIVTVPE
ncbi:MAG: hypothetical protein FD123_1653 [Bacteroidetes bacterium]|nr:MAG: hypothetical protein FD123_1653 [Bacteroidota bacterium]